MLNHEALESGVFERCITNGISVVVDGPFSGGILETGADPQDGSKPLINGASATDEVRDRCRKIEAICAKVRIAIVAKCYWSRCTRAVLILFRGIAIFQSWRRVHFS